MLVPGIQHPGVQTKRVLPDMQQQAAEQAAEAAAEAAKTCGLGELAQGSDLTDKRAAGDRAPTALRL